MGRFGISLLGHTNILITYLIQKKTKKTKKEKKQKKAKKAKKVKKKKKESSRFVAFLLIYVFIMLFIYYINSLHSNNTAYRSLNIISMLINISDLSLSMLTSGAGPEM